MNLLLIDEKIPSNDLFIMGISDDTKYITYSITDTFEKLTEKIDNFGLDAIENIGFVFVDERTPLKMFVSCNTFISFSGNVINKNNTTEFIKNIVSKYKTKNLDFLACNLLSYAIWKKYFEFIMSENEGLVVRASNDRTGNMSSGGDWILESTNEDISKLYFNEKMRNWNQLLDSVSFVNSSFLSIDGTVQACGSNDTGQMNNPYIYSPDLFLNITSVSDISAISCGNFHTGIIKQDGSVWTCGFNYFGQLGDGSNNNVPNPKFTRSIDISDNDISDAVAISCGGNHTGIIKQDGSVWMCGLNNYGQLGNDFNINTFNPNPKFTRSIDISDNDISDAVVISCGYAHTGIIKSDGSVWMCGYNDYGQLGDGSNNDVPNPYFRKV